MDPTLEGRTWRMEVAMKDRRGHGRSVDAGTCGQALEIKRIFDRQPSGEAWMARKRHSVKHSCDRFARRKTAWGRRLGLVRLD